MRFADYRGYSVIPHASGIRGGPYEAYYAILRDEGNHKYSLVADATLPEQFSSMDDALAAASIEAHRAIDRLLSDK